MQKVKTPTIIVILGATGDLSERKILPALFDLKSKQLLPDIFRVVGFSRRKIDDIEYKKFVRSAISKKKFKNSGDAVSGFLENVLYKQGDFSDIKYFKELLTILKGMDLQIGQCTNKLFYLAVPPVYYESIFKNLAKSGLSKPCSDTVWWTRILVEKPFGKDAVMAQKLDKLLTRLFNEEQVFRIDHYLAKETVQNVLSFRFSNSIFEPIWNNKHIEQIKIKLFEKGGVGGRGAFYDGLGALRDVGQNHLLQMLTLVTMDSPGEISAKAIRSAREKIIGLLQLPGKKEIGESFLRGQYAGYRKEKAVHRNSKTETYFKIRVYVDNPRWKGVPIILESGKNMEKDEVEIKVRFREIMPCFCPSREMQKGERVLSHGHKNSVVFKIQPEEAISVRFWAKDPGLDFNIVSRDLAFDYKNGGKNGFDAYEKVLYDCVSGDQTLFTTSKEVLGAWKFIDQVVKAWAEVKLSEYKKGKIIVINVTTQ